MLSRNSYESEDSLTSITIRQNFRLKRRSEQTQNSFRQIRNKWYEDQRREKQQKQKRHNIKMLSPIKNEVMVDEKGYNFNKLTEDHQNYHQNLCLNINIGNFNLHKNYALQNNIHCNQTPIEHHNLPNVVQQNVNQGVNQRFNDLTHNLEINRPYAQASQIPIPKPSISPNFTNSPKIFQKSSQQPAVKKQIMFKYKHYLVYSNIIGSGTYSKVYLGTDLQKNIDVAVKELSQLQDNQIKVLMSVDSPYIIKLQAHWKSKSNNMTYLVLDLCQRNLREEIKMGISMDAKMKYFEQVIYGMNALFSKNIIHRDLKFENILVTKDKVVKIADFGLAKDLGMMSNVASLRCGTPYTMAPQIFFHNGYSRPYYNQKCDIWSLGVILHEMLYNKHPFNYKSERMMKMQRVYIEKKYGYLDQLIDKALVKDPKYRICWDEFLKIYQNKNNKITNQLQMKRFENSSKPKSINKINNSIKQKKQKKSQEKDDRNKMEIKQVKIVQKKQERKAQIKVNQVQLQNNKRQNILKRQDNVKVCQSKFYNVNQRYQQVSEMNIIAARNPSFQPIIPKMATRMQLPVQQAPKMQLKFINRPIQQKDNNPSPMPKLQRSWKGNEMPQIPVDFFKNSKYNKVVQHQPQKQQKQQLEISMNKNETKGNISILLIMFCVVLAMLAKFVVQKI